MTPFNVSEKCAEDASRILGLPPITQYQAKYSESEFRRAVADQYIGLGNPSESNFNQAMVLALRWYVTGHDDSTLNPSLVDVWLCKLGRELSRSKEHNSLALVVLVQPTREALVASCSIVQFHALLASWIDTCINDRQGDALDRLYAHLNIVHVTGRTGDAAEFLQKVILDRAEISQYTCLALWHIWPGVLDAAILLNAQTMHALPASARETIYMSLFRARHKDAAAQGRLVMVVNSCISSALGGDASEPPAQRFERFVQLEQKRYSMLRHGNFNDSSWMAYDGIISSIVTKFFESHHRELRMALLEDMWRGKGLEYGPGICLSSVFRQRVPPNQWNMFIIEWIGDLAWFNAQQRYSRGQSITTVLKPTLAAVPVKKKRRPTQQRNRSRRGTIKRAKSSRRWYVC